MENPFLKLAREEGETLMEEQKKITNNLTDPENSHKVNDKKEEQ